MWSYFLNLTNVEAKGCKICGKVIIIGESLSTGHMKDHIRHRHGGTFREEERKCKKVVASKEILKSGSSIQTKLDKHLVSISSMDDAIVNFVIMTFQPFSVVDDPSFISMIRSFNPTYKQMSRKSLMSKIRNDYDETKAKLKMILQEQYYSLTTVTISVLLVFVFQLQIYYVGSLD